MRSGHKNQDNKAEGRRKDKKVCFFIDFSGHVGVVMCLEEFVVSRVRASDHLSPTTTQPTSAASNQRGQQAQNLSFQLRAIQAKHASKTQHFPTTNRVTIKTFGRTRSRLVKSQ